MIRAWTLVCLLALGLAAHAADRLVNLESRPGVKIGYWMMERPNAKATLLLISGGGGGIGFRDGAPHSQNFLIRSRDFFADAGYNVALLGKPTDRPELDPRYRSGGDHVTDVRAVVAKLSADYGKPVWIVGTSLGSISAAAAAVGMDPSKLAGIVLTSSVTRTSQVTRYSVPMLSLSDIRVPVLIMHNKRDECPVCEPGQAWRIEKALTHAPVKKLLIVEGGGGASGPVCEALHYHGYIGMEGDAAKAITDWIANPTP
jgi:pimeloyl-ACP methyl ester carboxylesterase